MLTAYNVINNFLSPIPPSTVSGWLEDAVWIDLVNPTEEERQTVEMFIGMSLPKIQETEELEASSHYEVYPDGFQVNCSFLNKIENTFKNINVAFLCKCNCLVSICSYEIPSINSLKSQWQLSARLSSDPKSTIIALLEMKIEKLADLSEGGYLSIEKISRQIFERGNAGLEKTIDDLSMQDDLNGKIRLCLMDGQRDLIFLLRRGRLTNDDCNNSNEMLEDIKTLLTHNAFLSERIDFLLNAALGFISIEQNKIIKIFSIAAVVLMPPTVIASIYGMNFHFMPELTWRWGYPLSILFMILAGISPYIYFKRKGWL
ncbi:MAG: magnesium/cobalt transporter CorA [Proteobacteria bacterium]|nr:magnesium/cobalt transporter CorA [Pseudomonadota bacterium]MBU1058171.1 magnesium/cobalt transporter CorA [Pseudomonadota bacterium]